MNTLQARAPGWIGVVDRHPAAWPARRTSAARTDFEGTSKGFQLTADESVRFMRIASECGQIRRHYDIYRWLGGEVQHFLPHEILLSAWGDFETWNVQLDLASGMPGVRTAQLAHCRVDGLVREAYARWLEARRQPVTLKAGDLESGRLCHCPIHTGMRAMRSVLVHGVHDKRSGHDSLFIAFTAGSFTRGGSMARFVSLLDPLVAQIDAAFRRFPSLPVAAARTGPGQSTNVLDLSAREQEVLESMCRGRTNLDIAAALDISPFTVKNHVQRIFRKIGVTNRTQAAARYAEALRQATLHLANPAREPIAQSG
jgi:transcriptional regulator EpsA